MDLSNTITPKSSQLNADDLIIGPRTIRITEVKAGSAEQPVAIHFEGDNGKPYLPGKSMRRVLVVAWGRDSSAYIGRRLTLYCEPSIAFGGVKVGGIRISHMSDIGQAITMALTETRGKKKQFTVEPLATEQAIDTQALSDIGDTKAAEGREALQAWWQSLDNKARIALKDKLPAWKEKAA
jgi:hypothetical protein